MSGTRGDLRGLSQAGADLRYARALPALYGWQSKLATADTSPARALILGDSIAEGLGAPDLSTRWISLAQERLRALYNAPGVAGGEWVPPQYFSGPGPAVPPFFTSWARAGSTFSASYGFGFKGVQIDAGGTATITKTCSSVDLWFRQPGTAATAEIRIDGVVVAASLNTNSALSIKWNSGALAPGPHTVLITGLTGSSMFVGSYFYNGDESSGVQLIDGNHSGARLLNYDTPVTDDWKNHLVSVGIDLLVIECITNDCRTISTGYSSAQFGTYLTSIISKARAAKPNIPILLMPPYEAWFPVAGQVEPWSNYIAVLDQIARSTTFCALFDMSKAIPNLNGDPFGTLLDSVHPSARGHALLSELAISALSAP